MTEYRFAPSRSWLFSGLIALGLALAGGDPLIAQDFQTVASNKEVAVLVDRSSVSRDADDSRWVWATVRLESRKRFGTLKDSQGLGFETSEMRFRIDCSSKQGVEVDTVVRNKSGRIVGEAHRQIADAVPVPTPAGSLNAIALSFICNLIGERESGAAKDMRSEVSAGPVASEMVQVSGTAFAVTSKGHFLTNNHVVRKCDAVAITTSGGDTFEGRVVARDSRNDLALIATGRALAAFASFRSTPIRAGESVTALGYPLRGLLALEANVSVGIVSATAGLRNDISQVQISAPVQPGNSGGPLLDPTGAVVGVVVAKLDALEVARLTGDVPQNINFAVKGELAQLFLRSFGLEPDYGRGVASEKSVEDVVGLARDFTVQTECEFDLNSEAE